MSEKKFKYTMKEKQDYFNRMSKKGATYKNKEGKIVPVSDFQRGINKQKADQIAYQRYAYKKNLNK